MGRRSVILPVLTLVLAGAVYLWSRQQSAGADGAVAAAVQAMVEAAVADPPRRPPLGDTDALFAPAVRQALAALGDASRAAGARPTWTIERGEASSGADGSASHTATIALRERPVLVVRLLHRDGRTAVIGVAVPDAPTAAPAAVGEAPSGGAP